MYDGLRKTPVFILAGGAGERLAPLTETKPKPAVSFGGNHQILDFTLSNCINSGFRRIFVLTQYQHHHLDDYVRQNLLRMSHLFDWSNGEQFSSLPPVSGKRYRGTADAVFQNLPILETDTAEHVVVASGDHIYAMDYLPLLKRHLVSGADLTIAAVQRPVSEANAFGVLAVEDGRVTGFMEKPAANALPETDQVLVNMGIYIFKRSALFSIAERATQTETDFGHDIIPKLIQRQQVAAYDFGSLPRSYWRDVGSLDSYYDASMDLLGTCPAFDPQMDPEWPIYSSSELGNLKACEYRVSRDAVVKGSTIQHSIVSHGSWIERGAVVEDSVILPGARVGKNAIVRHAIVAEGASIPDGTEVGMDATVDRTRFLVTARGVVVVRMAGLRGFRPAGRELKAGISRLDQVRSQYRDNHRVPAPGH
jgi:glucose-1-phosphate adenylyltransferase